MAGRELAAVQGPAPQDVGRRPRCLTAGQGLDVERDGMAAAERPVILKLRGAIDRSDSKRERYVVGGNRYVDCLSGGDVGDRIRFEARERMAGSRFRFLGDSMRAWNVPVVLNRTWGAQRLDLRSLTVQREPASAAAREIEAALCRDRGDVRLRCVEPDECVERLEAELSAAVAV